MYVHPLIKMICPKDPQQALLSNVPMCFYIIDLMQNRTLIIPKLKKQINAQISISQFDS